YLAMALAVAALQERQVARIILTRPAVEAGERLGFLPGDLLAKVDPYLRPLFDALYDMLDAERLNTYMERGTVEVAPLAYMRGRVLETRGMVGRLRRARVHRYELPLLSAPAEFEPQTVPLDPYALGLLLGDGCLTTETTPSFTTSDPELAGALDASLDGIELR